MIDRKQLLNILHLHIRMYIFVKFWCFFAYISHSTLSETSRRLAVQGDVGGMLLPKFVPAACRVLRLACVHTLFWF